MRISDTSKRKPSFIHLQLQYFNRSQSILSLIMAACCPEGSLGAAAPSNEGGGPRGRMLTLNSSNRPDMPCYQVGSENPKKIICVFSDVFGIESGRHKAFCDSLSERLGSEEVAVWMPDLFRGRPLMFDWKNEIMSGLFSLPTFLFSLQTRLHSRNIEADLKDVILLAAKQAGSNNLMVGTVGFCFGGWVIAKTLAIDGYAAGVGIHPSFDVERIVGGKSSVANLADNTGTKPILLLPASNDHPMKASSDTVQRMASNRDIDPEAIAVEFPDVIHGWVTRGDRSKAEMRENQDRALNLTVEFFKANL